MKRRIVILGGGFGGAYCARALNGAVRRGQIDVTLIDRNNYFVFYPLLVEAGTGSLHPRHAVVAIRSFAPASKFRMGEVTRVDVDSRLVTYRVGSSDEVATLAYDDLVVALGSVTRFPDISGLKESAFQVKSLGDAVALRDHAIRMVEMADTTTDPERRKALLHFVVIGANFTGVEVAGEFHVFLRQACRAYPNLRPGDCKVSLIELGQRVLPALESDLSVYAARKMRQCGIEILLGTSAKAVEARTVVLDSGARLDAHTVIWCAGIAPNPLLRSLPLPSDERGYLLCGPDLRVRGHDNIWAIGDTAVNPDPEGNAYPATAQHAVRQGVSLARNLLRVAGDQEPVPFVFDSLGSLAALGCRTGVAKVLGFKLSGFLAWFLWRTVYLLKMPGFARKLRIALDWTLDLCFRRDFVQLGVQKIREP